MDRRSVENMKLDRRLIGRRGWISQEDLQRELAALPDVSRKVASDDPNSESADIAADSPATPAKSESTLQPPGVTAAVTQVASDAGSSAPAGSVPED